MLYEEKIPQHPPRKSEASFSIPAGIVARSITWEPTLSCRMVNRVICSVFMHRRPKKFPLWVSSTTGIRDADYMTRDEQGIWEKFIPNIPEYAAYKYSVWAKSGDVFDKSDPYGFHFETRPGNATKAYDIDGYEWGDASWLDWRKKAPAVFPIRSTSDECHLGS